MNERADTARARDALHAIPPSLPRDEWVRVGMAAHAAGLELSDFDAWSAQADSYREADCRATWRSFKPGAGIGPGTLYRIASEHGYSRPINGHGKPPARPVAAPKPACPGMGAAAVWKRCQPATAGHPYIAAKQGTPDGLRVVPEGDPLRIAGQSVAGWLAVPVVPLGGSPDEPVSLQFIPPQGKKLNLPGAHVAGVFTVGELEPGGTVQLCEGIGQAWACWKATGAAAVVCFGWGRVRAVAAELRQRDASARLVLVPDAGKESDAERIAAELGASVARMPEGSPPNFDANDYAQVEGFDALELLLSGASEPPKPAPRFRLLSAAALRRLPPQRWRVRGLFPERGVVSIYGPSTAGKSFIAIDMAAAIAEGAAWFGLRTAQAPVVYLALEGEAGIAKRVAAWETANRRALPESASFCLQAFKLTEQGDVADLAAAIPPGAVVFIDTTNRAAAGLDENSSADMGRILEAAKALADATGGLVVLVHHSGKDLTKGMRGHSSLFAAMDGAVEVSRDGDRREWRSAKSKDGEDGRSYPFRLAVVELGADECGDVITSCVIRRDESPQDVTRLRLPKGGNQKVVLDALGELLRKSGNRGKATAPPHRPCVELEAAVDAIAHRLTCEPLRRKERTRQALTGLVAAGVVTCREGWLWLP